MVSRSDSSHAVCREAWLQPPLFAVSAASDMGWHWCFLPLVAAQLEPFALPPSFEGESSVKQPHVFQSWQLRLRSLEDKT